jgi:hypothetical protein
MHETEAERRLRQLGGGEFYWYDMDRIMSVYGQISDETFSANPCVEISFEFTPPTLCTLGTNPLVKFTKFNFKF